MKAKDRMPLDALSVVDYTAPRSRLFDAVARPVVDGGRRFRTLHIGDSTDLCLLDAISRGEFATPALRATPTSSNSCAVPPDLHARRDVSTK